MFITAIQQEVDTLACSAFGTGVGGMSAEDAANQMFQAYRLIIEGEWKDVLHSLQAPFVMR